MNNLSLLETWKLNHFRKRWPELSEAKPLEILEHAIEEEATERSLSAFDPAVLRFAQMRIDLEAFALLQEKSFAEPKESEPI